MDPLGGRQVTGGEASTGGASRQAQVCSNSFCRPTRHSTTSATRRGWSIKTRRPLRDGSCSLTAASSGRASPRPSAAWAARTWTSEAKLSARRPGEVILPTGSVGHPAHPPNYTRCLCQRPLSHRARLARTCTRRARFQWSCRRRCSRCSTRCPALRASRYGRCA